MPFPADIPRDQLLRVFNYALGRATYPIKDVVEDAYDVLGYGLKLSLPDEGGVILTMAVPPQTTDEPALSELAATVAAPGASVPWEIVLPLILQLIQKWMSGK